MATVHPTTPTHVTYAELQAAFDHFNATLFNLRLPYCLITLQREKRTFGYFSNERFAMSGGTKLTDEIAMNPSYFVTRSIKDTLSTLVHEMVHQWQHHFGGSGRRGYHNKQWADKMEQLGLMPSSTGAPGGRKVGDKVSHYIIEGGNFDVAATKLLTKKFRLSWVDRFPPGKPHKSTNSALTKLINVPADGVNRSNRIKYRCNSCHMQVWGKPELNILCGEAECDANPLRPADITDETTTRLNPQAIAT